MTKNIIAFKIEAKDLQDYISREASNQYLGLGLGTSFRSLELSYIISIITKTYRSGDTMFYKIINGHRYYYLQSKALIKAIEKYKTKKYKIEECFIGEFFLIPRK